jgi:lipopolysaccharide/colanic/teichoic acid biosynthesis glycosyltransferase
MKAALDPPPEHEYQLDADALAAGSPWQRAIKRALDVAFAAVALAVLAPVLFAVAIGIRWSMGSPVFFHQERPGYRARSFRMIKFRTMRNEHGPDGQPRPDGERLTRFGTFLRSTSLDELPELWNVLRGDMSLVGPRPLLPRYTPYFTRRERRRFNVYPGITGLAQIRGRNEATWADRLQADVEYVETWSLWLDIRILARTVLAVLGGRGVIPDANSIMRDLDVERSGKPRWNS